MSWWDVFIILFIALALWRGYQKGLALRLGGWVGGVLLFVLLWHNVDLIDRRISARFNGRDMVAGWIKNYLSSRQSERAFDTSGLLDVIHALPLPNGVSDRLIAQLNATNEAATTQIYDHVSQALAVPGWQALLFLLSWLCGILLLYLLGHLVKRFLYKVPFLESLDRFAGAFVSAFLSLILIAVLGAVARIIGPSEVVNAVKTSFFADFLGTTLRFILSGSTTVF